MKKNNISPAFVEELKAKNDIVNIIGKYVRLEKKGNKFWGCCPFHHEKTGSFCINEYEQFYHCFGCGESGDVITFLRKYENLSYMEVIRMLAENAGMEVPEMEDGEQFRIAKRKKDKSLQILAEAKKFYVANLYKTTAKPAQEYIKKRKLTKRELDRFELGYSPNYYDIVNHLKKMGFKDDELKESGVCELSKNNKPYDFLSERLVFPISNAQGDCIGFSGRDLTGSGIMKYKNTAQTNVFNKSRAIYGINLVKKTRQEKGIDRLILVEGQFDVITMHKNGFENAVACLGTAVTKDHVREIGRLVQKVTLCLDGDGAGQKATLRTIEVFESAPEISVKVAVLPNGSDPDEFLAEHGKEGMQRLLDEAMPATAFRLFALKKAFNMQDLDEKAKFVKEALKIVKALDSVSEQEVYLTEIHRQTGISVDFLRRDLEGKAMSEEKLKEETKVAAKEVELDGTSKAIKFVLAAALHKKAYANLPEGLGECILNPTLKKLYDLLIEKKRKGEEFLVTSVFHVFEDVENDVVLSDVINFEFDETADEEYFNECLVKIKEERLKFRKVSLSKQYNEEIDKAKRLELLKEINEIDKQLKKK